MATVEDYRAYAKQYFALAQVAESEEVRRALLEMASYWTEAALRTECLGDSCVGPIARHTPKIPSTNRANPVNRANAALFNATGL